ncbi:threonine synthase [Cohnella fermenti]|uniref:Threonine synthase n=1 Tax=Cohnella fermenti TaxID=2565925 RepID=A0A4S4BH35_9BACL|nr:threonine synthase [Cohnella fermenti]THF73827.1 threonine synthase [Cohnella fermenti]
MLFLGFECTGCRRFYPPDLLYCCSSCGASLDAVYNYERWLASLSAEEWLFRPGEGVLKYRELLPLRPSASPISLGEGNTPLLKIRNISNIMNIENIYIKNETVNPTLSFKDRAQAVAVNAAADLGLSDVICASTGNTGVAAAAYAARAGLGCLVYVPAGTPEEKLAIIRAFGAELRIVEGNYGDAYEQAAREALGRGAFNLTSTYLNPYSIEGHKTIAYEIAGAFGGVPDWIVVPIGAGPLLSAIYKGFRELRLAGWIDRLPRMAGVQAAGCAPIVKAFEAGDADVAPWDSPRTIASGIADPLTTYPADGTRTLRIIRESGGAAIGVDEGDILGFRECLAREEGIVVEAASATAMAALVRLKEQGWLDKGQSIVTVATGHGLKDMAVSTI